MLPDRHPRITLGPFTSADFDRLISWTSTQEELFQFAGAAFDYPLTREQLAPYANSTKRKPLKVLLSDTQEVIGHCELNHEREVPRLSRILIGAKEYRGRGIGKEIVNAMLELLFADPTRSEVDLGVFDWNTSAIKCYESVGFRINPHIVTYKKVGDTSWTSLNMIISRDAWLEHG